MNLDLLTTIEGATEDAFELFGSELTEDTDAELADEIVDGALQLDAEFTVGGDQLEATVNTRHRADGDEPTACAAWQALYHCGCRGSFAFLRGCFGVRVNQTLTG